MWVCESNFNHSSANRRYTDKHMISPGTFADQLRQHMVQLRPSSFLNHGQPVIYNLTHVFVQHDKMYYTNSWCWYYCREFKSIS